MTGDQLILTALIGAGYLLPTIIATNRKHPSVNGIAVVNIFFGWTLLGWVIALAWSLSGPAGASMKRCPACAEDVRKEALRCRHCGYDFRVLELSKRTRRAF